MILKTSNKGGAELNIQFQPNSKNRTGEIVDAIMRAEPGSTISFSYGRYDFYREGAFPWYLTPPCNTNSDKQVIFPLIGKKNLTIDGNGSEFLFHDRLFPFSLWQSNGITFKNFSIDFSFPRYCQAYLKENTDDGLLLEFEDRYQASVSKNGNLCFLAGTELFSTAERRFFLKQENYVCYLTAGEYFYENTGLPAEVFYCRAEQTKNEIFLRKSLESKSALPFEVGKPLIISYDENRENDVFFLDSCSEIKVENVRIFRGAGMGIVGRCCHNVSLEKFVIAPHPGELYSTTADGILLTNFTGDLRLTDCLIKDTMDDGINVHGYYTRVEKIVSKNRALVRLIHPSQAGTNVYKPQDRLVICSAETLDEIGCCTVIDSFIQDDLHLIQLTFAEEIIEKIKPGDMLDNPDRTPRTILKNCTFDHALHLRLCSSQETIVNGCTFRNSNGLRLDDLMKYWYASGRVRNVEIQNCTFSGNEIGIGSTMERYEETGVRHENVRIHHNHFSGNKQDIVLNDVDGAEIYENTFDEPGKITFHRCEHITSI